MNNKKTKYVVLLDWHSRIGLSGNSLIVFSTIYSFSQDEQSYFYGSSTYLANICNCSNTSIFSILKKLTNEGYIEKREIIENGVKLCQYKSLIMCEEDYQNLANKKLNTPLRNLSTPNKKLKGGTKETYYNIKDNTKENNIDSFSKEKQRGFSNPDSFNKDNTDFSNKDNIDIKNKSLKKPSLLNTMEYKLIERYYDKLDCKMVLPNKDNNYKISKSVINCTEKIKSLLNGTFIRDYPVNNIDDKVIQKINHPLLLQEIQSLFDEALDKYKLIHKGNYYPENKDTLKKNMNDFLYNSHAESSWFLYCLKDIKSNKKYSLGQLKSELNTNIITIYMSRFKYKLTGNQEYNLLLNIKNTLSYYNSFLEKVENIYRWNPNFLNYFDNEISFCMMHSEYLKRYKEISPGHVKLTGAIGEDFARYCLKEYNVNIKPTMKDLEEIAEKDRMDNERTQRIRENEKLQDNKLSNRDKEEIESMLACGDIDLFDDEDDEDDDFTDF